MDEARLVATLSYLADAGSDLCRSIRADCERSRDFTYEDRVRSAERQKVIEILREQPEFFDGRLMMWAERSSLYPLYETELPDALIRSARSDGVDAAMHLLRDILAVEEAVFCRVVPVWGLSVETTNWIAEDVCIAPLHAVPCSPPYRAYDRKRKHTGTPLLRDPSSPSSADCRIQDEALHYREWI